MPSTQVMSKWGKGDLKSQGHTVTSQKQAEAIMFSERRKERAHGGKYPEKKRKGVPLSSLLRVHA